MDSHAEHGNQKNELMEIEILRNLSIIWLSIFCIAGLLVPIVGLYFAIRGMNTATNKLPTLLQTVQSKTQMVRGQTDRLSNRVAEPVLAAQNRLTQTEQTLRSLSPTKSNQNAGARPPGGDQEL